MDNPETTSDTGHEDLVTKVENIYREAFNEEPQAPVLGEKDDVIVAANMKDLIGQDTTVNTLLQEDGQIVGFNLSIPIGVMNPARSSESHETAYILFTAIDPKHQGKGLIKKLNDDTFRNLLNKGYLYAEIDAVPEYAEILEAKYSASVIETNEHNKWPEVGPQKSFRLDLTKLSVEADAFVPSAQGT